MQETVNASQVETISHEDVLGPPRIEATLLGLSVIGSLISGFAGGILVFVSIYLFLGGVQLTTDGAFPYVLSLIGLFATTLTAVVTLWLNGYLFPHKYKHSSVVFGQIAIFSILFYVCITPLYIYVGGKQGNWLMFVFTIHVLIAAFGTSLIGEVLSNYRYVLLSIYGSFIGFFVTVMLSIVFFFSNSASSTTLYALMGAIIMVNFFVSGIRFCIEYLYYQYYRSTGNDQLGDIFSQIEAEEQAEVAAAKKELERFI